jgi:single-stranded-DNA-specific exonuclease
MELKYILYYYKTTRSEKMEWKLNEQISDKYVKELAKKLNTDELLVRIVLNRNNDESFADLVLNNIDKAIIAPEKLVNAKEVADRITEHIKNGSYIFIHGDYDVDGLDAGYIMYDIIRNIIDKTNSKARLDVYFPERKYGYGLSMH